MSQFDHAAMEWDEKPTRVKLAKTIADAIANAIPLDKNWAAMELGCGTGLLSLFMQDKLKSITAIDNSSGMLQRLKEKIRKDNLSNITPLKIDLTEQVDLPGKYDLIFSSMVFHHIKDYKGILGKMVKMLNPTGMVAIADLDVEDGNFHDTDASFEHKGFDRNLFTKDMENAGLVDIESVEAFVIDGSIRGSKQNYPVFLATGKKPKG